MDEKPSQVAESLGGQTSTIEEIPVVINTSTVKDMLEFFKGKPKAWSGFANCDGQALDLFTSAKGFGLLRPLHFCAGCGVRIACLQDAVVSDVTDAIRGGLNITNLEQALTAYKRLGLKCMPQNDTTPTPMHFEFMLSLHAYMKFKERFKREPSSSSQVLLDAGEKIPMANGKMFILEKPFTVPLGEWVAKVKLKHSYKEKYLFQYELAAAGFKYTDTSFNNAKVRYAFVKWRVQNPDAKALPINEVVVIEDGEMIYDGQGSPIMAQRHHDVHIGNVIAKLVKHSSESDGVEISVDKIERYYYKDAVVSYEKSSRYTFNNLDDIDFEIFISAYERWKASEGKYEFLAIETDIHVDLLSLSDEARCLLDPSGEKTSVAVDAGTFAHRIREGDVVLNQRERKALLDLEFIFDIPDFLMARDLYLFAQWIQSHQDVQISEKYFKATKLISMPAGAILPLTQGEYVTQHPFSKRETDCFNTLKNAYKGGRIDAAQQLVYDAAGVIFDFQECSKAVIEQLVKRRKLTLRKVEIGEQNMEPLAFELSVGSYIPLSKNRFIKVVEPIYIYKAPKGGIEVSLRKSLCGNIAPVVCTFEHPALEQGLDVLELSMAQSRSMSYAALSARSTAINSLTYA